MSRTKPSHIESLVRRISGHVENVQADRRRKLRELREMKAKDQKIQQNLARNRAMREQVANRTDADAENDPRWAHLRGE